jgi:L-asparaginase/Glu-tRNA(Gln) amidotransferase subunit D
VSTTWRGRARMADLSALGAVESAINIKPRESAARSVLIINTGGTIGMRASARGSLEPCPGYLSERLRAMSEFQRAEMPATDLLELLPLLDSSDMGPDDWDRIARVIDGAYWRYDGFVVVMGTDTMSYAASALSFMLEALGKPVIVTGSMLPLSDLFNDAHRNLIVSVVLAGMLEVPEVCVFMDARLLRGNRTVKTSCEGLDAFESPNIPPLATLETGVRLRASAVLPPPKGRFRVHLRLEKNVAVWRMVPGFSDEYIENSIKHCTQLRAIVLELCVAPLFTPRTLFQPARAHNPSTPTLARPPSPPPFSAQLRHGQHVDAEAEPRGCAAHRYRKGRCDCRRVAVPARARGPRRIRAGPPAAGHWRDWRGRLHNGGGGDKARVPAVVARCLRGPRAPLHGALSARGGHGGRAGRGARGQRVRLPRGGGWRRLLDGPWAHNGGRGARQRGRRRRRGRAVAHFAPRAVAAVVAAAAGGLRGGSGRGRVRHRRSYPRSG